MSATTTQDRVTNPVGESTVKAVSPEREAAFEATFERHYPRVYGVALRVTGSPEDAEEIALDVFLKLSGNAIREADESSIGGWLYRTTLNASFNAVRARRRRLSWFRKLALVQRAESATEDSPTVAVERDDDAQRVRRALALLPGKQRNALVLRSHGFQYSEIAATLDIAPSSVGTTLARGEKALRRQLQDEVGDL